LRVAPPSQPKTLVRLVDLGVPYSMNMIMLSKDYLRRSPAAERQFGQRPLTAIARLT
jgi:hypothetical protein